MNQNEFTICLCFHVTLGQLFREAKATAVTNITSLLIDETPGSRSSRGELNNSAEPSSDDTNELGLSRVLAAGRVTCP